MDDLAYVDSPRPLKHVVRLTGGHPHATTLCGALIPMHRGWRSGAPTTTANADAECLKCQAALQRIRRAR